MLDPITLISLLTLQTQTRISIAARGEEGRREGGNVTLLLHISSFLSHFGEGIYTAGAGWSGVPHLADEGSHRSPGPHWAPQDPTGLPSTAPRS